MLAVLFLPFALQAQNTQTFDFEDNAIPADWTNDATHPWVVTSTSQGNGHSGTYCIMSGNAGVSSSTSTISATFAFIGEGSISFLAGIYGEGTSSVWDKCIFKIDGEQQFSYGALATWATYSFDLEAGIHTFEWSYSKDGSVNPTGDAFYLDNIVVDLGVATSCHKPLAIAVGEISDNSIDITWTPGGDESAWSVSLYDENNDLLPGYPDNASVAEYSFSGLDANTTYKIGVKADCGGELSAERTILAHTACQAVSDFPWVEDFESYNSSSDGVTLNDPCWVNEHISGSGTYFFEVYSGTSATGGNSSNMLRLRAMSSGTMTKLVLPLMDLPENYAFSLDVYRNSSTTNYGEGVRVYASTNGQIDGATELAFISRSYTTGDGNNIPAEYEEGWYTYTLPIGISGSCYIILRGESLYGSPTYMDNFVVDAAPTCLPVSALTVDATTNNSITLSWADEINTNASYIIYNMADTSVIADGISELTYMVDNLTANTAYSFGVTADCGADDLSAIRIVNSRTACDAISELPYNMGFEENEILGTSNADAFPFCWTRINNLTSGYTYYPYSSTSSSYSGDRKLYFYASSYATYADTTGFVMPELDVTTYPMNANRVTFWAKVTSTTDYSVQVGTMTDPNDMSTFTLIETVTVTGTDYTKYAVSLAEADANDAYVAFIVPRVYATMYMDDVTLELIPSCPDITGLTVTAVTNSTMTLAWNAVEGANGYTIYNSVGEVVGTADDTTYTVENLNASSNYTFGVQANCSAGEGSISTVSGRTACGVASFPWSENFNDWTTKSECWSFLSGALSSTPTSSTSAWTLNTSYGDYITIDGKALTMNLYSTNRYWAVTPPVEIMSDDAVLSVDVAVSAWSAAAPNYDNNDTLAFLISTDNGATFSILQVLGGAQLNTLGNTYTTIMSPVTGYNGQVARFAIYGGSISGTSPYDNRIAIDNVVVGETPACMPVVNLTVSNITSTGATLTWEGNADGYTIYNMADTTVDQYATDTIADIYALDPNTHYTFGVTANCGSDESDFRVVSFTTLVSCPAPSDLTALLTPGDGTIATLTWHEIGDAQAWQICINGDTTDLIDVTDTTYDFTDLIPETAYTAKVRAYCSDDDQSVWSNTITFTPTDSYSVTVNEGTTTNSYVPVYGFWVDNITKSQFIIPAADLAAMQMGTLNKLTFYASDANVSWGAATFDVYLTETSATTLSDLADYSTMTQVYAGSLSIVDNKMEVTFTNPYLYMGGNLMVGFLQTVSGTYSSCNWYGVDAPGASMGGYGTGIAQRDFLPKTTIGFTPGEGDICFPVTGLTVDSVTATSVILSWSDENNSGATYTIYNMADSSIIASGLSDFEYEITDLTSSTSYTFGVAANCSAAEESFIIAINATTDCEGGSCQITIVGADSYGDGWNGNGIVISQNGVTLGTFTITSGDSQTESFSVCSGTPVTFSWVTGSYASETSFEILNFFNYPLYSANGGSLSNGVFFTVDNACTSCVPVADLTVDSVTSNSVTISWTGTAESYDVYNGETLVGNTFDTTYTFTNLSSSSSYVFGVIANCSDGETSMMMTIASSTECGLIEEFPYVQGFASEPACWTMLDADGDGQCWYLYGGAVQSASYSGAALTPDNWLISPQFSIPATGNYEVTWAATAQDQSWPAEHYGVFISTTGHEDTADFTMIQEWTLGTGVFNPVIDLSAYSGQNIYIALRHFNCTDQFRLSIDEFIVREQAGANQVTINVGQNNPAYGTVSGAGIYNIGDDVTVSATAAAGYTFSKWVDETNSVISTDNPYTFVAATDLTLKAIFLNSEGETYTITVQVNDSTMGTATGGGTYTAGEQITLTATPFSGYNFVNWTQVSGFGTNVIGTDPEVIISVTGDKTFVANFESSGPVTPTDPTVTTAAASDIAQTTATLNGTITNPDNVTITAKGFEWKTTVGGTYAPVTVTGNNLTYNLTNLTPNTGYTYKAFITFNGTTVYGNEMTFTTLPEDTPEPCDVPTNLHTTDIQNEAIAIAWDANANVGSWNIRYSTVGGTWNTATSNTNSYTITGLTGLTDYEIQVQANCGNGNLSEWSGSITAQTTNVGIEEHLLNSISLYPNPANDVVNVQCTMNNVQLEGIEVIDVYGKVVRTIVGTNNYSPMPIRINISGLANGMYFVRVTTDEGVVTKTFVKQ